MRLTRAPRSPLCSVHFEYSMSFTKSNSLFKLNPVGLKTTGIYLSTDGKPFWLLDVCRA